MALLITNPGGGGYRDIFATSAVPQSRASVAVIAVTSGASCPEHSSSTAPPLGSSADTGWPLLDPAQFQCTRVEHAPANRPPAYGLVGASSDVTPGLRARSGAQVSNARKYREIRKTAPEDAALIEIDSGSWRSGRSFSANASGARDLPHGPCSPYSHRKSR